MRLLAEWFPEFAEKLDRMDDLYREKRTIDEKTYQFICLALSIKNRSAPCVKKHFNGALQAGATVKEIAYIMALTFRESAGSVATRARAREATVCGFSLPSRE